ncbi:hypothetical protein [Tardibacter chloracetimidivorans]|uniref:hypothetical protein n=1 Tax=Tardibacter chloracetimidivorans TaxID=1921510 RepID=UPI001300FFDC|nr:hypothetical protein [Tardibacter chloracetimidivorans]
MAELAARFWFAFPIIGLGIALLITRGTLADVKDDLAKLQQETAQVLLVIREVADNPRLKWIDAGKQVRAVGDARDQWKRTSDAQTAAVEAMEAETARMRKVAESQQARIAKLVRQRDQLANKLSANKSTERLSDAEELRRVEKTLDDLFRASF